MHIAVLWDFKARALGGRASGQINGVTMFNPPSRLKLAALTGASVLALAFAPAVHAQTGDQQAQNAPAKPAADAVSELVITGQRLSTANSIDEQKKTTRQSQSDSEVINFLDTRVRELEAQGKSLRETCAHADATLRREQTAAHEAQQMMNDLLAHEV